MYQYTRHIFGAKDSPTCANYALQRTARDHEKEYPDAAKAVHEKFYMDDYLDSMESPDEALKRSRDLVNKFEFFLKEKVYKIQDSICKALLCIGT